MDRGYGSYDPSPEGEYRRVISEVPVYNRTLGTNVSYNWFSKIESDVNVSISGNGTDALTEDGKEIYNNFYP